MKINTRITRKIVGSDYSAQEPRMTAFLCDQFKDEINPETGQPYGNRSAEAYYEGKDLYAMIAQSAYNNNYEDNLEFWPEGTEIEIDGKKVICGHKTHLNVQGKTRRKTGKVLNLASTYGMGPAAAGEKLGFEGKEAAEKGQELLDNFFKGFPTIKKAINWSQEFLKENGYVEGLLGRRRHLPWINDPNYEVKPLDTTSTYNPFLICNKPKPKSYSVLFWEKVVKMYIEMSNNYTIAHDKDWTPNEELSSKMYEQLAKLAANPYLLDKPCTTYAEIEALKKRGAKAKDYAKFCKHTFSRKFAQDKETLQDYAYIAYSITKDSKKNPIIMTNREKLIADILEYNTICVTYNGAPDVGLTDTAKFPTEPVLIQANTGRKAQASRQCFNARIQGSAATLTKLAMIDIANDKQMTDMNAKLIIPVHDELLVECPAFYAEQVEKRLPELMIGAAKKANDPIPQACDPDTSSRWYSHEMAAHILDDYKSLINGNPKKNIPPMSHDKAVDKICEENSEFPRESILPILHGETDDLIFD